MRFLGYKVGCAFVSYARQSKRAFSALAYRKRFEVVEGEAPRAALHPQPYQHFTEHSYSSSRTILLFCWISFDLSYARQSKRAFSALAYRKRFLFLRDAFGIRSGLSFFFEIPATLHLLCLLLLRRWSGRYAGKCPFDVGQNTGLLSLGHAPTSWRGFVGEELSLCKCAF